MNNLQVLNSIRKCIHHQVHNKTKVLSPFKRFLGRWFARYIYSVCACKNFIALFVVFVGETYTCIRRALEMWNLIVYIEKNRAQYYVNLCCVRSRYIMYQHIFTWFKCSCEYSDYAYVICEDQIFIYTSLVYTLQNESSLFFSYARCMNDEWNFNKQNYVNTAVLISHCTVYIIMKKKFASARKLPTILHHIYLYVYIRR